MKNLVKVWITVRMHGDQESIMVFDNYDEIYGLYDFVEQIEISKTTNDKLNSGNYYAKRWGNTIRAYGL